MSPLIFEGQQDGAIVLRKLWKDPKSGGRLMPQFARLTIEKIRGKIAKIWWIIFRGFLLLFVAKVGII